MGFLKQPECAGLLVAMVIVLLVYLLIRRLKNKEYAFWGRFLESRLLSVCAGSILLLLLIISLLYQEYGIGWGIGQIICFATLYLVFILLLRSVFRWIKAFRTPNYKSRLLWAALAVWSFGFILYFIGFYYEGTKDSPAALIIRPALSAAELFISNRDLLEVSLHCKENPLYMGAYSIASLLALIVSASVIIRLTGMSIKSWIKLRTMKSDPGEPLYIFWGVNIPSLMLAKDIQKWTAEHVKGGKADIIFIDNNDNHEEEAGERMSFERILNMFFIRRKSFKAISDAGVDASICVSELDPAECQMGLIDDFMKRAGLTNVLRMMNDAARVHVFFLSEDGDRNIMMASAIRDSIKRSNGSMRGKCTLYCHSCMEKINYHGVFAPGDCPMVRIVDTAILSVNQLKADADLLPVNFVNPDTTRGVATKPFEALVLGFGQTGLEALKFLYEFGSFVGPDGDKNKIKCYVVDPDVESLRESFVNRAPGFSESDELVFVPETEKSAGFWNRMKSVIDRLDYVVVTVGNDIKGLSLAENIYNLALKYRNGRPFCLALRTYDSANHDRALKVADYYNSYSGRANWKFKVFGEISQLFTYENVVEDTVLRNAMEFYYVYQKSSGEAVAEDAEAEWNKRRDSYGKATGFMCLLAMHNKLVQQEQQDISNARHIETKMRLAGVFGSDDARLKELLSAVEGRELGSLVYPNATEEQKTLLKNMAKCEHLRWNASNLLLGYVAWEPLEDGNKKDYVGKRLSCLVSNETLEAIPFLKSTIHYDYNTVDVSFRIKSSLKFKESSDINGDR